MGDEEVGLCPEGVLDVQDDSNEYGIEQVGDDFITELPQDKTHNTIVKNNEVVWKSCVKQTYYSLRCACIEIVSNSIINSFVNILLQSCR